MSKGTSFSNAKLTSFLSSFQLLPMGLCSEKRHLERYNALIASMLEAAYVILSRTLGIAAFLLGFLSLNLDTISLQRLISLQSCEPHLRQASGPRRRILIFSDELVTISNARLKAQQRRRNVP